MDARLEGIHAPSEAEAAEIERVRILILEAIRPSMDGNGLGLCGQACLLIWAGILKLAGVTRTQAKTVAWTVIDRYLKDGN